MADLSLKAQEKEIDGVVYKAWPVPFSIGRPTLVRLVGILAPMLARMVSADGKEVSAAVFETLPSVISDADLTYFAKVFGDAAQYRNDAGDWVPLVEKNQAAHFEGRYLAYFQWIVFCARVNFEGFFTGIKSGVGVGALAAMAK